MPRLDRLPEPLRSYVAGLPCPEFPTTPCGPGPPLAQRKVALVSTAGVHLAHDRPFQPDDGSFREIPGDSGAEDLVMSHVSSNFDRGGFQKDWNVVFPLDLLREFAAREFAGRLWPGQASMSPSWSRSDPSARAPWAGWHMTWKTKAFRRRRSA